MDFGHEALWRDEGHKVVMEKTEMMISNTHIGVQKEWMWYVFYFPRPLFVAVVC